jgi:hypothetical protein
MSQNEFNHLLKSIAALTSDQIRELRYQLDHRLPPGKNAGGAAPGKATKRSKRTAPRRNPLTRDDFNQRLMAAGLITRLPDPSLDIDDDDPDDQPVIIKGEPLSETIIRERR